MLTPANRRKRASPGAVLAAHGIGDRVPNMDLNMLPAWNIKGSILQPLAPSSRIKALYFPAGIALITAALFCQGRSRT